MKYQSIDFGHNEVLAIIAKAVEDTKTALDIKMSPFQIEMLVDSIYDVYQTESIEDITECLKKGRQGHYGFGHNQRGTLSMLVIQEWMQKHLETKILAREQKFNEKNEVSNEQYPMIDYEAFKKRKPKPKPKNKPIKINRTMSYNPYIHNAEKIKEKIREKVYQNVELTEFEEEFMKYHKIEVRDGELYQTFTTR